jgi:hypothetical protein
MSNQKKTLFFAFEVEADWETRCPAGRIVPFDKRVMSIVSLGDLSSWELLSLLDTFPLPPFEIGMKATCDRCLFLPEKTSSIVACHLRLYQNADLMVSYQREVVEWLQNEGIPVERRNFSPYVTIAHSPFITNEWKDSFEPIDVRVMNLKVYEGVNQLTYFPIWSFSPKKIGALV